MTDEQWLREGLSDAVPPPPANPDRARAAERLARRRRRTTALAVGGTAGAVAAAAVLTAVLASGGDDPSRPDGDLAADPPPVVKCPPAPVEGETDPIDEPDPDAPAAVPEGATSARLCQGPGIGFEAQHEPLLTDVEILVETVNGLEEIEAPDACTLELGPGYRIAFGYADGSRFVVSGKLYGCRTLVVGSGYRSNPEIAQQAFLDLLDAQEEADDEGSDESEAADLSCAASPSGTDYTGITAAILCIDDGNGTQASAVVDPADLDFLTDDMAIHQSNAVLRCVLPPPHPTIIGAEGVGPAVAITSECGTAFWRLPGGRAWTPSDDAISILDRLVREAR